MKLKKEIKKKSKYNYSKLYLIRHKLYNLHTNLNEFYTSDQIESKLQYALNIINKFHKNNRKILFLGIPAIKLRYALKLRKITKHYFLPKNVWVNGLITNTEATTNRIRKEKPEKKTHSNTQKVSLNKTLLELKEKPDLIVNFNYNFYDPLNEISNYNRPIISLFDISNSLFLTKFNLNSSGKTKNLNIDDDKKKKIEKLFFGLIYVLLKTPLNIKLPKSFYNKKIQNVKNKKMLYFKHSLYFNKRFKTFIKYNNSKNQYSNQNNNATKTNNVNRSFYNEKNKQRVVNEPKKNSNIYKNQHSDQKVNLTKSNNTSFFDKNTQQVVNKPEKKNNTYKNYYSNQKVDLTKSSNTNFFDKKTQQVVNELKKRSNFYKNQYSDQKVNLTKSNNISFFDKNTQRFVNEQKKKTTVYKDIYSNQEINLTKSNNTNFFDTNTQQIVNKPEKKNNIYENYYSNQKIDLTKSSNTNFSNKKTQQVVNESKKRSNLYKNQYLDQKVNLTKSTKINFFDKKNNKPNKKKK